MANRRRGEVDAVIDGEPVVLCLTLGALCELEAAFAADDLVALSERFATGRLSARDLLRIFACGLSGGGRRASEAEVAAMRVEGGIPAVVAVVAELLAAAFGLETAGEGSAAPSRAAPGPRPARGEGASPFPGMR